MRQLRCAWIVAGEPIRLPQWAARKARGGRGLGPMPFQKCNQPMPQQVSQHREGTRDRVSWGHFVARGRTWGLTIGWPAHIRPRGNTAGPARHEVKVTANQTKPGRGKEERTGSVKECSTICQHELARAAPRSKKRAGAVLQRTGPEQEERETPQIVKGGPSEQKGWKG